MSSARVDYIAPWWTYWLHNFPHINLRFQPIDNSFQPEDENYQQVSSRRWDTGLRSRSEFITALHYTSLSIIIIYYMGYNGLMPQYY